jgi:hypothetical protein
MTRLVAPLLLCTLGCAAQGGTAGGAASAPAAGHLDDGAALAVAGARCAGGACTCRGVEDSGRPSTRGEDEGPVAEGKKRFELRSGRGLDKLSISVAGQGTLHKNVALVDASCGYIDLPPGRHRVLVHVEARDPQAGIAPRVFISEYGTRTHDWYDTFQFKCGDPNPCYKDDMKDWLEAARKRERGIYDPCGSTRIEDLKWGVSHSPEQRLDDLELELTLHVYKFEPRFAHGGATCKGLAGGKAAEQEGADTNGPGHD